MESVIKIICMYCAADLGEKDGHGVTGTSHGICRACFRQQFGVDYDQI